MEEQRSNGLEKVEEIMLPGFRFHPTDEELVGFYLKRKIQQRQLPIELIKQLDIYKFDPWDLPKLASTGEKEWYFYCPRDRKYRNSARPNRVTGAGFWKATGTDRPIYSSEGNKCIGLKKSLVFYRGRAAKGIKTDWMMHEFRLPSVPDSAPSKRFMDKSSLANDSWAICRIFKKTNSTAQRALSQSWVASPPLPQPSNHHLHLLDQRSLTTNDTKTANNVTRPEHEALLRFISTHHLEQYPNNVDHHLHSSTISHDFSSNLDHFPSFKLPSSTGDLTSSLLFSPLETLPPPRSTADVSSMIINMSSSDSSSVFERVDEFGGSTTQLQYPINGFPFSSTPSQVMQVNGSSGGQWENITSTGGVVPFGLPVSSEDTNWRLNNLLWDSSASLPSEVSSSFSTNKCYT